jgi:uncharacterized protein (TIGR02246 family)
MNLPASNRSALGAVVAELMQAWNDGDGRRFASQFALDAEQVNIFGVRLRGRCEIGERHDRIFKTIFRGSVNTLQVLNARLLAADVLLAQMSSLVDVPQGLFKGELRTIVSMVLIRNETHWEIVLFHNTRVTDDTPSVQDV